MGPDLIIGVLLALLAVSGAGNGLQYFLRSRSVSVARARVREAEDARHAAELRSYQQIDAMLDRISTSPRIEVRPPVDKVDLETRKYFSDTDTPDDVEAWNEYRGEPSNEEAEVQ